VLRNIQLKEQRLKGLSFRAYSAAQLILPSGEFAAIIARQDDQRLILPNFEAKSNMRGCNC
jgi:hypothetical protein